MENPTQKITWDPAAQEQFQKVLEQIPALVRDIAEIRITKKLESILGQENRWVVSQKDMINALFAETPPGFVPLMKNSLQELGIDYTKFGYAK